MQTVKHAPPIGWTAPSNGPAIGPTPIMAVPTMLKPATLNPTTPHQVLDNLVAIVVAARGAVLASVDGFPIAKSSTMPSEPAHAAMLAAAVGISRQLVAMGDGTTLRQLVVDHDGGLLLVWPIGSQRVLAVLADATVDQRALRGFVQGHVRILAQRPCKVAS